MFDSLAELAMRIVCLFKRHNLLPMGSYNYCARCGHLEVRRHETDKVEEGTRCRSSSGRFVLYAKVEAAVRAEAAGRLLRRSSWCNCRRSTSNRST
jgi:DNA-directed RNA polymerase subunit RPC12/RpoP